MKIFYKQSFSTPVTIGEEYTSLDLKDSIQKTRKALDIAYAGFDNAVDTELIDSYIYEINSSTTTNDLQEIRTILTFDSIFGKK